MRSFTSFLFSPFPLSMEGAQKEDCVCKRRKGIKWSNPGAAKQGTKGTYHLAAAPFHVGKRGTSIIFLANS